MDEKSKSEKAKLIQSDQDTQSPPKDLRGKEDPLSKRLLYILIGSTPIMLIFGLCINLIYLDYVKNNYSFFDKSLFLSNIDSHTYESRVACARLEESPSGKYTKSFGTAGGEMSYNKCYATQAKASQHACFRYLNDFVVSETDADRLIDLSKKAFSYSPSNHHGFNTFDIVSGQITNDNNPSINLKKFENENIFSSSQIKTFLEVKDKVLSHLKEHFGIDNLYLTKPVLFTRLNSQSKKSEFVYWEDQIDHLTSKPTTISTHVQFNTYVKEFLGSRFNFRNADNRTILSVQPKKGRVLAYTSGGENEYYIEPMESGEYFYLRLSFTCDPNYELVLPRNEGFFKVN